MYFSKSSECTKGNRVGMKTSFVLFQDFGNCNRKEVK
jgi:hypothetical protein